MLGGGIPFGQSVLVAGPSGSGKTVLATQFIREGVRRGERGVIAIFEKRPSEYAQTSAIGLDQAVRDGQVGILQTRPLDLSIDETQHELTAAIERLQARRVVIDSAVRIPSLRSPPHFVKISANRVPAGRGLQPGWASR